MAETIKQVEALPDAYPEVDAGILGIKPDPKIWQRIEAYTAHRWTPREVIWTVEGEGEWTPPLTPATITEAEKWEGGVWVAVTLPHGPYGLCLQSDGPYRITATVGHPGVEVGGVMTYPVPPAISSAVSRLNQYLTIGLEKDYYGKLQHLPEFSATSIRRRGEGENAAEHEIQRPATWIARAMQNSGAADLLRPYRRA